MKHKGRNRHATTARNRRRPARTKARAHIRRPAGKLAGKTDKQQDTWAKVAHVIATMRREGMSLARASRDSHVSPRTVRRLAGASLRKTPKGHYAARPSDRLWRVVRLPAPDGMRDVVLRDSKQASVVGKYWNAVHRYLAAGKTAQLGRFNRVRLTDVDGNRIKLLTDRAVLDRLGSAGVLSFESIYARAV